jgi:hypothetical protein
MRTIGFLLLTLPFLISISCEKETEFDPDVHVYIPDKSFLGRLKYLGVDKDDDGFISFSEAESIDSLHIINSQMKDATGIEAFTNLIQLDFWITQLTHLSVSNNLLLKDLNCSESQLTSLDVSKNAALEKLICYENPLDSLDISNNTAIKWLGCSRCNLSNLDISKNPELEMLECAKNSLSSLDISNNTKLYHLSCENNQLVNLDISNNTALEWIILYDMPTLTELCVWVMPFPPQGTHLLIKGSPNVSLTTECSK